MNRTYADQLPKDDPERQLADRLSDAFTQHVDFLRKQVPNPIIRRMGALVWDIIGSRTVMVCMGPPVGSMHFLALKEDGVLRAHVILPRHWEEMCCKEPAVQLGAVVFTGSKVIDYCNDRIDTGIEVRSYAYESEFLLQLRRDAPEANFNPYQLHVMSEYPDGIRSEKARPHIYEWKNFTPPPAN